MLCSGTMLNCVNPFKWNKIQFNVWLWLLEILSGRGSGSLSVLWLIQVSLMISSLYKAAIRLEDTKTRDSLCYNSVSKQAAKQLLMSISNRQSKVDCSWTLLPYTSIETTNKKWTFKVVQPLSEIRETILSYSLLSTGIEHNHRQPAKILSQLSLRNLRATKSECAGKINISLRPKRGYQNNNNNWNEIT